MDPVISFLRGIAIGFAIAAPIGPVGILCIRKALADGRLAAFVAGLGAACADTLFGAAAAFGIGAVMSFIDGQMVVLKVVGGLFMLGLGLHTWRSAAVSVEAEPGQGPGMLRDFLSTFAITITNPGTIFGVAGVFAALGPMGRPGVGLPTGLLVAGIFGGSALWWLTLSGLASAARNRFTPERMRLFNHLSGAMLMVFGVAALGSLLL
ncbi:LysE family translocator [Paramagnetospirillum magneticum]|uniref:LysE family translocator n=1 Tax=Paramagnetospirillum magneticum TaxID=84159 RepID=UPI0002D715A6|nr:LysE family transporter [Paramagnetospirillum magneticum]